MRNIIFVLICFALFFCSCEFMGGKRVTGNGVLSTQQRNLGDFNGVDVSGPIKVFISQNSVSSVKIEGDENLLEYIEIENQGDDLEIRTRRGYNLRPRSGIKIYITAPSFDKLAVTGSGELKTQTKISNGKNVGVSVTGSGDMILNIDAPSINSEITGSGNITINGGTRNFSTEVTGSGEVHAFDLLSENTKVTITGSGDVEIFASKQLDINISGSGDVKYKGNPSVNKSVAGAGDIRQIN
jgi:hypothetical protein